MRRWTTNVLSARGLACALAWAWALTAAPAAGQGWIEPAPGPGPGNVDVRRVATDVSVRVRGRVAEVEVTEWFRNDGGRLAEGHYLYPLPGEAAFDGFSLFLGDQELRGEIMDAGRARAIYEEIVRRRADPALIEYAGHGLLRARVFPIQPGEEREIRLRYTQVLERAGGALHFRYAGAHRPGAGPAAGGPRVDPPTPPPAAPGWTPALPRLRPDEPGPVRRGAADGSFRLVVEDADRFLDPFSPTHALDVARSGGRLSAVLEGAPVGRMSVFLPLAGEAVGLAVAAYNPAGEDGYVMITLAPGTADAPAAPRDVTVVVDVSGSMSGEKIAQARAAIRQVLSTLGPDDRFRLLAFSTAVRMMADGWRPADRAALDAARTWVDRLQADGGTNIEAALDEALRLGSPGDRLPVVLFVTDGLPSVGEQSPQRLADRAEARAGRARIFAFGIGHDVNTHLLDRLGQAGRGSTDYVQPGEDVERAISLVSSRIRHPVLTDLVLDGAPAEITGIYPVRLPDVFAGEELVLLGRYSGGGTGELRVRGRRGGRDVAFETSAVLPGHSEDNAYLARLWGSRKLGHLMRQVWTEGTTPSLIEEIRKVALRYGLPSPYTSYLVEEPGIVADGASAGPARPVASFPAPPPSADMAQGAGAVRQAARANRFRSAESVEEIEKLAAESAVALDAIVVAGSTSEDGTAGLRRFVAGRLLVETDGVWREQGPAAERTVTVERFSAAWFAVARALPEIAPLLEAFEAVRLRGERVDLGVGDGGETELDARALDALVRGFRGID